MELQVLVLEQSVKAFLHNGKFDEVRFFCIEFRKPFPPHSFVNMNEDQIRDAVEEATLDFSLGEDELAAQKLENLLAEVPDHYDGWLALTEVQLARRDLDAALEAGEKL